MSISWEDCYHSGFRIALTSVPVATLTRSHSVLSAQAVEESVLEERVSTGIGFLTHIFNSASDPLRPGCDFH